MIRITNKEELRGVFEKLERLGYTWWDGSKPTTLVNDFDIDLKYHEIIIERSREKKIIDWYIITQAEEFIKLSKYD